MSDQHLKQPLAKEPLLVDLKVAPELLHQIAIESISDIRVVGEDIQITLVSGRKVVLQQGGILAFLKPQLQLEFFDGVLTFDQLFRQIEFHDLNGSESTCPTNDHYAYLHWKSDVLILNVAILI